MHQTFYVITFKLDGEIQTETYSDELKGFAGAKEKATKLKAVYGPQRFEFIDIHDLHSNHTYVAANEWRP